MSSYISLTFICFFVFAFVHCQEFLTVETSLGQIRGKRDEGFNRFLGIPYAEQPVGPLRWQPPLPKKPWTHPLDALVFPPICPQSRNFTGFQKSEACLYLNIFTPPISTEKYPVLVFLPGGAFQEGHASRTFYNGQFISSLHKTVQVVIGHRVGALGFLSGFGRTGNYGILDQRLAFEWIVQHIHNFGGDSRRITLAGQSAGGMSISLHLVSKKTPPFFHKAIIQSSPVSINLRTQNESLLIHDILAFHLGCKMNDLNCMQSKTWQEILSAQEKTLILPLFPPSINQVRKLLTWQPILDDSDILDQPLRLILQNSSLVKRVPILIGTTRDEGTSFTVDFFKNPIPPAQYRLALFAILQGRSFEVTELYPPASNDARYAIMDLLGDFLFVCSTRALARGLTKAGLPTYMYHFDYPPSVDPENHRPFCNGKQRACHSSEIVFTTATGSLFRERLNMTREEIGLSNRMIRQWTDADPSGWKELPLYRESDEVSTSFNVNAENLNGIHRNFKKTYCDFLDKVGYLNNN